MNFSSSFLSFLKVRRHGGLLRGSEGGEISFETISSSGQVPSLWCFQRPKFALGPGTSAS